MSTHVVETQASGAWLLLPNISACVDGNSFQTFQPWSPRCVRRAIEELKKRKLLQGGQQVAIVQSGRQPIWRSASTHNISVRQVPEDPYESDE